jgi:type I restriction enzyme S subunit
MSEVIPEGWSIESLGSLAGKITSGATPKVDNPRYYGGTVPFLKIDDITSLRGRYVHTAKQFITDQALNETSAKLFPPGTVLTTMYGTIGSTAILSKAMATNQAIAAFIDLQNTTSEYLYQLLTFEAPRLASSASQTTQANISGAVLKEYCVPVPPLPEQQKIATILSSVDDVIEKTRTQIDKLKDLKTGMMQELLTKGIGHTEFKDSLVGRIPTCWSVAKVQDLLANTKYPLRSGPFGSALLKNELVPVGIPFLGIDNVHVEEFRPTFRRFVSKQKFQELKRFAVFPGDVMVTIMGTVGRCCVVPENVGEALSSKHVWTLTLQKGRYIPELLCWQINFSDWVKKQFINESQGGVGVCQGSWNMSHAAFNSF